EPFSKRVEPQKVAMAAGGRAGADVSDFAGVVAALESGVGELFPPGDVFVDAIDGSRDVIEEPVGKAVAARRVGIVKDQDKEFGFLGRAFPGKFGRDVFAFTGEAFGEFAFVPKYRTLYAHRALRSAVHRYRQAASFFFPMSLKALCWLKRISAVVSKSA